MDKPCKCETVSIYDGEHRCMVCYRIFKPMERPESNLERMLKKDYGVQDESNIKTIRGFKRGSAKGKSTGPYLWNPRGNHRGI